ncbi:OmpH family outer membrane protein [Halobacteriovorax sp. XZX-3]|uniref:OmpH family outer membrane protein n=1 Tax=unclassified Halobacteriovorax TaxID=2639665 RepID=UPI000CD07984|nr:OmpH family outer membrane protein [Halobacteriovorax sp. DA5]POB14386.1 hypothetical protein C0Z22_04645 [Halobacteriovorax sp. DA5]
MKTTMINSAVLAALLISSAASYGQQDDPLLSETDQVVHTDEINIDGFYKKKKKPSQADKIQKLRRELEEKHEQMMRKNVEDMRLQEEKRIADKIQKALEGQLKAMDEINNQQAAPARVQAVAPVVAEPVLPELSNKLTIETGYKSITGEQKEWTAGINFQASVETVISERVSIGISAGFMNLTIQGNELSNYNNYGYYNYNNYNAYNSYSQNDEISYNEFNFGGYGKFYFSRSAKIKPYLSVGTGIHFGSFEIQNPVDTFNETKQSMKYVSGSASLGAEVNFAKEFSAQVGLSYEKNIFRLGEEAQYNGSTNQKALVDQARNIENADTFTLGVGLSYLF